MNYNNKKVLVFGAGESGEGAINLLNRLGAKTYIFDENTQRAVALANRTGAKAIDKNNLPQILQIASLGVISPGISNDSRYIVMARAMGVKIIPEIELAYSICLAKKITVTGTNGKSSTVRLLTSALNNCGKYAVSCGNIGNSFSRCEDKLSSEDYAVIEASSFQLENIIDYRSNISILLNITQDHVDRHGNVGNYVSAKMNLVKNVSENEYIIANFDDETIRERTLNLNSGKIVYFSAKNKLDKGVFVQDGSIYSTIYDNEIKLGELQSEIKQTTHLENILGVIATAIILGLDMKSVIKTINTFAPLSHTVQKVATKKGISYVNDSKGTNVSATLYATECINGKIALIVGGRGKGENYQILFDNLPEKVENIVFYGENAELLQEIAQKSGKKGKVANSMDLAVEFASEFLDGEGTVLFSPACASFDNYTNYKERGEDFIRAVNQYEQ